MANERTKFKRWVCVVLMVGVVGAAGCGAGAAPTSGPATPTAAANGAANGGQAMSFTLGSNEFHNGEAIPRKYTCDGDSVSVPLQWADEPAGTKSYGLIVDDPDAPSGTFVHWVLYNLPPDSHALEEGVPADASLSGGRLNGKNGAGKSGYTGPCPPSGTHRYFFKLYALDAMLTLQAGATKDELLKAMEGHVLGEADLVGTYNR